MTVLREVSFGNFLEILRKIEFSLKLRGGEKKVFRVGSLDENWVVRRVIEVFEKNSVFSGSVGSTSIYVIPVYYFEPFNQSINVFLASLIIERDVSGYTVKVYYWDSGEEEIYTSSREEAEKFVDERFGGFMRLLEKALSIKHPNAPKLAELIDCLDGVRLINFLYRFYGDEILSDNTIPGVHSVCSGETKFFINDKIVIAKDISLRAVSDIRGDRVFRYDFVEDRFYEVSPDEKIFYKALFAGHRGLLEPEFVLEDDLGERLELYFSEAVVDGREVALIMSREFREHPILRKDLIHDIIAVACDVFFKERCQAYSFLMKEIHCCIDWVSGAIPIRLENISRFALGSERIRGRVKRELAKRLIERHEWEILPA